MSFAVVRTYSHAMEAQMACGALQAEGIDARIADEHLVTQDWLLSNAVGGVRVQVPLDQLAEAMQFIGAIDAESVAEDAPLICPSCESADTAFRPPSALRKVFLIFAIIVTGGFALLLKPTYKRCNACGARWG